MKNGIGALFMSIACMGCLIFFGAIAAGTIHPVADSNHFDEITENVFGLCAIMKENRIIISCDPDPFKKTIDVLANLTPQGAYMLCDQVSAAMAVNNQWHFHGYSMRVLSPLSGGNPIAICHLPR